MQVPDDENDPVPEEVVKATVPCGVPLPVTVAVHGPEYEPAAGYEGGEHDTDTMLPPLTVTVVVFELIPLLESPE